jgi:hypothetical protein
MRDHRQSRKRKLAIAGAALVVLAVAGGLGGVRIARHRGAAPVVARTSVGPFHLGEQVSSRARMTMKLDTGAGAAAQEIEVQGDWTANVTDIHDGLAQVACQLSKAVARVDQGRNGQASAPQSGQQQEAERQLAHQLMQRFFVSHRADGSIDRVWLPKGLNTSIAGMLLRLAAAGQLVHPAGDAQPAWIVRERDVNGEYLAAYRQEGEGRFIKQKSSYLQSVGSSAKLPISVEHFRHELRADPRGRVLEADLDETVAFDVGMKGLSFKVTLAIALRDATASRAEAMIGAFARERSGLELRLMNEMGADAAAQGTGRDRALLAGASANDLHAALNLLPADGDAAGEQARTLATRFGALFRLNPGAAGGAPALLRGAKAARGEVVLEALSRAETADAQAALGAIARDVAVAMPLRTHAIQALAIQTRPSEAAVTALRGQLDDPDPGLRQSAVLAYGAAARALRPRAPEQARPIVDELLRRLATHTDEQAKADVILALGNAGDVASLTALRPVIEGGLPALRGPAIRALRFIADPAVDPLLASLLRDKSNQDVRLAAIAAIAHRDVGPFTMALAELAEADAVEVVRQAAIDLLGNRMGTLPALRAILERASEHDPNARVRALAARHLAGARG